MMISTNRLKTYSVLAAAPCAALGGIAAETHAAPSPSPDAPTARLQGSADLVYVDAFTAADLQFQAFIYSAPTLIGGLQLADADLYRNSGAANGMKFWAEASGSSQVISWSASGRDRYYSGYGGVASTPPAAPS